MKLTIEHRRLSGVPVLLVVDIDADGAVLFWRAQTSTGEHVVLSTPDKWCATVAMTSAIARMRRGAA